MSTNRTKPHNSALLIFALVLISSACAAACLEIGGIISQLPMFGFIWLTNKLFLEGIYDLRFRLLSVGPLYLILLWFNVCVLSNFFLNSQNYQRQDDVFTFWSRLNCCMHLKEHIYQRKKSIGKCWWNCYNSVSSLLFPFKSRSFWPLKFTQRSWIMTLAVTRTDRGPKH